MIVFTSWSCYRRSYQEKNSVCFYKCEPLQMKITFPFAKPGFCQTFETWLNSPSAIPPHCIVTVTNSGQGYVGEVKEEAKAGQCNVTTIMLMLIMVPRRCTGALFAAIMTTGISLAPNSVKGVFPHQLAPLHHIPCTSPTLGVPTHVNRMVLGIVESTTTLMLHIKAVTVQMM